MVTGAAPARSTGGIDPGSLDPLAVVVTGLGTTNPLGGDLAATWRALRAGRCAVDRDSTPLNSTHTYKNRKPSSA